MAAELRVIERMVVQEAAGAYALSPDGRYLAGGMGEPGTLETVVVWELGGEQSVRRCLFPCPEGQGDGIRTISWHPHRPALLTGSWRPINAVRLWSPSDRQAHLAQPTRTLYYHRNDITDVRFSPLGSWVLSCSTAYDKSIRRYAFDGRCLLDPDASTGHLEETWDAEPCHFPRS